MTWDDLLYMMYTKKIYSCHLYFSLLWSSLSNKAGRNSLSHFDNSSYLSHCKMQREHLMHILRSLFDIFLFSMLYLFNLCRNCFTNLLIRCNYICKTFLQVNLFGIWQLVFFLYIFSGIINLLPHISRFFMKDWNIGHILKRLFYQNNKILLNFCLSLSLIVS